MVSLMEAIFLLYWGGELKETQPPRSQRGPKVPKEMKDDTTS